MKIDLKTKCLIQSIVGKYAGIIIRNILRISFIIGVVSQLCWKRENNPFTIPVTDTVQFAFTLLLPISSTLAVSRSLTLTHTHTQNNNNNNKAVSTISFLTA